MVGHRYMFKAKSLSESLGRPIRFGGIRANLKEKLVWRFYPELKLMSL